MDPISFKTRTLLVLSMLKGIGPAALKKIALIAGFENFAIEDLGRLVPQIARCLELEGTTCWANAKGEADRQLEAAEKHRSRILSPLDADYPRLLSDTRDDPFLLFVKGSLARDPNKSVAIIGTREPTRTGAVIARRIASTFASQRWSIVSGLALGCDAIAHRAALDAGGHTVAVLAHGLQTIAPSRHKGLAQDIIDAGGALVSEYRFGQSVLSQQFVKRDRTQAGLAQGVVMIQSDVKGGSLHASRAALDYNRWLAVPYPTPKDIEQGELKIQGNLVIADGTDEERTSLLKCSQGSLSRVLVLRGREDILRLAGAERDPSTTAAEFAADEASVMDAEKYASEEEPPGTAGAVLMPVDLESSVPSDAINTADGSPSVRDAESERNPVPVVQPPSGDEARISDDHPVESAGLLDGDHGQADERSPTPEPIRTKRGVRYHVALVNAGGEQDLRIVQIPSSWRVAEFRSDASKSAKDFDLIVVLATRLQHLQDRVDEVKRTQPSLARAIDEEGSLHLQFFVEDVLTHMKRTVDDLSRLRSAKRAKATVVVRRDTDSTQLSLLEAQDAQGSYEVDLVMMLDQIVKSLPLSVAMPVGSWRSKTFARHEEVDVPLADLVHSFNGLVTQALASDGEVGHLQINGAS